MDYEALKPPITAVARRGVVRVSRCDRHVYGFIMMAPGYKKAMDDETLLFACTGANIDCWKEYCPHIEIEDSDGTLKAAYPPKRVRPNPGPLELVAKTPLFKHQERIVKTTIGNRVFGIFHDMGTGKSATAIAIASELFLRKQADQLLFVTTKNNIDQFLDEQIPMHTAVALHAVVVPSTKAEKLSKEVSGHMLTIGVCSHGSFQGVKSVAALQNFLKRGRTVVALDESTAFKGWSTKRVDNLLKLRNLMDRVYLMSGDPSPNGLEDLFAQFYILDQSILGHASMTSFRNEYCVMGGQYGSDVLSYKNKERLYDKIAPYCEFVNIKDCQDMPLQTYLQKKVVPTAEQRRVYQEVFTDWVALLDSGDEKLIKTAADRYISLQTVSNGWLKMEDGSIKVLTHDRAKMVLAECSAQGKMIIWCRFHQDIHLFKDLLKPEHYALFYGLQDAATNTANRLRFQQDPEVKYFLATAPSGGAALNLQIAHHAVYFSNSYSWFDRSQSERRIWRTGQTENCTYVDLFCLPVDRQIRRNLQDKRDLSKEVSTLIGMKALALELALLEEREKADEAD
jgi:SNF2 family DNA or RNA helicase